MNSTNEQMVEAQNMAFVMLSLNSLRQPPAHLITPDALAVLLREREPTAHDYETVEQIATEYLRAIDTNAPDYGDSARILREYVSTIVKRAEKAEQQRDQWRECSEALRLDLEMLGAHTEYTQAEKHFDALKAQEAGK